MLNKVDDGVGGALAEIEVLLRGNNPFAPITRVNRADVAATDILDRRGFELERVEYRLEPIEDDYDHYHNHINASGIASVSLSSGEAMDGDRLEEWLEDLLGRFGTDILRTKGIVSVAGEDRKLALQAVNMMLEGDFVGAWGDDKRVSRLVFIGRNLNRGDMLETGFLLCRKAAPEFAGKRRDMHDQNSALDRDKMDDKQAAIHDRPCRWRTDRVWPGNRLRLFRPSVGSAQQIQRASA